MQTQLKMTAAGLVTCSWMGAMPWLSLRQGLILNVPQTSTRYNLQDEEVPFLVADGAARSSGLRRRAFELGRGCAEHLLRAAAQTASGLYLKLIGGDASLLRRRSTSIS